MTTLTLSEHHRQELYASGLTDETIDACGFYTENCPNRLGAILQRKWHKSRGDGLVIPFRDSAGNVNGFKRVKPMSPRKDRNGRAIKYESPSGSGNHAFFPPGVLQHLENAKSELLIVEGEKKSAAGTQAGFPTIGLIGVYGWKDGKGADRLIPDLDIVAWNRRRVFIVYDSDLADKPEIRDAESRLAQQLANRGAIVKVCRLPDSPNGEKQGLDDYLISAGKVELRKRIDAAEDPEPPDGTDAKIAANQIDAMPEARTFLSKVCTHEGNLFLRCQHDEFLAWDGLSYVTMIDAELKARLWQYLDPFVSHLTSSAANNVLAGVMACTLVPARQRMPAWLDGNGEFPADEVLATQSGLLHLPSLVSGMPPVTPLTPRFFPQTALDYEFDPEATFPTWLEFLDSLWPHDNESIESLQQLMGYLLLPDTRHHKLFLIVGPRRSGKGTIGRTIKALVGPEHLGSSTLASLARPFGLWPLLNRTVTLIADARLSGRTDAVTIVERLLSISGEDPQDIHRKNLPTITGVRLSVRFICLAFVEDQLILRMSGMAAPYNVTGDQAVDIADPDDRESDDDDPFPDDLSPSLRFMPGCFVDADASWATLELNHFGPVVASVTAGNMRFANRDDGLWFAAEIDNPDWLRQLRRLPFAGFSMSFDSTDERVADDGKVLDIVQASAVVHLA